MEAGPTPASVWYPVVATCERQAADTASRPRATTGQPCWPRDAGRSPMCSRCVCREQSGTPVTHAGGACRCPIQTFSIVIRDAPASPGGAQAGAALAVALRLVAPRGGAASSEQIRSGRLSAEGGTSARTAAAASSQSGRVPSARACLSRSRPAPRSRQRSQIVALQRFRGVAARCASRACARVRRSCGVCGFARQSLTARVGSPWRWGWRDRGRGGVDVRVVSARRRDVCCGAPGVGCRARRRSRVVSVPVG